MVKATAARMQGDDYQGRFFWIQVCRLFDDRTKVKSVEIESNNIKSLDDVVVNYSGMFDGDEPINADYYQVKFHVTANGAFTWQEMMNPEFINASSISLLQRLRDAQRKFAPEGRGCRFLIFSPWTVHPDDEMAEFLSQTDGRIRWSVLSLGGSKSKMGKIRTAWSKHLGLESDDELQLVLAPIRINQGPTLDNIAKDLNLHLQIAGLRPVHDDTVLNQYDDLARKFIEKGHVSFKRKDIEAICRREGLWIGRTIIEPDTIRLGIRSFWRFAENLEDETDAMSCLRRHFNGRTPKDPSIWNRVIAPEVEQFLRKETSASQSYHIRLQTHGTIAFLAGWILNTKSGTNIVPVQDSFTGRHIWRPEMVSPEAEKRYTTWQVTDNRLVTKDRPDMILAISIMHDIAGDVLAYSRQHLKSAGKLIHFRLSVLGPASVADGTHALILAQSVVAAANKMRGSLSHSGVLHVFFSAPNGFMFIFGRLAHVLGHLALYEHDFEVGGSAYCPSISIPFQDISEKAKMSNHKEVEK